MSKRMKVLIAVLAAILVLTVGGAAMVMAQDEPTPTPETRAKGLLARVAEILDIPQEELVNAFKQAQQEMRQEAFLKFLDKAVEQGRIEQEEADEFLKWWEQKPETAQRLLPRVLGFPALRGRHMLAGPRGWHRPAPPELAE